MENALTKNAAQRFWEGWLADHPKTAGWFLVFKQVMGFFGNGHIVVWLGHWLVSFCGSVAETATLLSVLWITSVYIAPNFVLWVLSQVGGDLSTLNTITDFAIIALALLPEVIVFNAIVTCIRFWHLAATTPKNRIRYGAWAVLHTLPTTAFIVMTIWTMWVFIHNSAHLTTSMITVIEQTRGQGLTIRVFAGWFFCLTSVVYARLRSDYQDALASAPTSVQPPVVEEQYVTGEQFKQLEIQLVHLTASVHRLTNQFTQQNQNPSLREETSPIEAGSQETRHGGQMERHTEPMNAIVPASEEAGSYSASDATNALIAHPRIAQEWLTKGVKSVSIDEIMTVTGYSRQKVAYHAKHTLARTPANPQRYTVTSVLKWLADGKPTAVRIEAPKGEPDHQNHNGHLVSEMSPVTTPMDASEVVMSVN